MVIQTSLALVIIGAVLLLSAGDWLWPQAWAYLAEMALFCLALGFWFAKYDPDLSSSRLSSPIQKDQKPWDRGFMAITFTAFLGWMVLIALDARRFRWSETSVWCEALGAILIALCMIVAEFTFRANTFATPQTRTQGGRGHRVPTAGPYAFVRHPMYTGALLYFLGVPLLLGSWCGFLLFPLLAIGLGVRAVGEERMLRSRLTDYDIYTRRVRYRFVPYIW
jgi:protein-S-isoprenylcysteine O-methyltransferase Ste14